MRIAALAAIFVIAAVPVATAQSVAVPPIEGTKDPSATTAPLICVRSDPPTGSRFGAHKTCHTEAEWRTINTKGNELMQEFQDRHDNDMEGKALANGG